MIRLWVIGLLLICALKGISQKNMRYATDTTVFSYIDGHFADTIINYQQVYKQKTIKLMASNPDFTIVEFTVIWTCPGTDFLRVEGDTLSHRLMKSFRGSNYRLQITSVLAKNKKGYYYWIRDKYYEVN